MGPVDRDDSRERAEQILATLNLLINVHPGVRSGPEGKAEEECLVRFEEGIARARANIVEYILLRRRTILGLK